MDYSGRLKKLQNFLKKKKLDAFLVAQPHNRRFLCGFSGGDHGIAESSGFLLVPKKGKPYFLTDFRYKEQAEKEVALAEVLLYPRGLLPLLETLLPDLGVRGLAFESGYTLHSTFSRLSDLGKKGSFCLSPQENIIEKFRCIKDEEEIKRIQKAVRLNEEVFQEAYGSLSTKMTEIDLATTIETTMRKKGAEAPSFDTIVASGTNSSLPHAVPTEKKLQKNKPLTIDMGLVLDGYCSDMTRSFSLGKPSKKYISLHRIVRQAQLAALETVSAGVRGCDVDKAARKVIKKAGYGKYFGHALGHGVGLAVHEAPSVSPRGRAKLKEGMVITIEPGIYIPGWGGIRLEDMVVVRKNGYQRLNRDTTQLDI